MVENYPKMTRSPTSQNNLGGLKMNTPVQFDDKNRPTHEYLRETGMNVVKGMDRNIPEYIPEEVEIW